jgi:acetyl-CoA carboxylase biotin carboxylase subunit
MFKRILIANRGEIALRIIRACQEMGIETVVVYSEADKDAIYLKSADEAICIGPAHSSSSYLDIPRIISAAEVADVEAIHPGYGFLAENDHFAEVCNSCRIAFIGPKAETIALVGNKSQAKRIARKAKVPVIPGSNALIENEKEALKEARRVGYPVVIKASAGGGGRGMRVAHNDISLVNAYLAARSEAEAAFNDSSVYMEKFIRNPRHVEIQILADSHGDIIHLGERDCSLQRRHQKLIEESPCPAADDDLRERMGEAAKKLCKAAGYINAGTVEFLLDADGSFYFMELNARVQVEHPVTEMVTGIDIIKSQIRIAAGEKLELTQDEVKINGCSIECRINAESPDNGFRPCPGTIKSYFQPGSRGVRVDSHVYSGYVIPPFYDSMIGKLIVHGADRDDAINIMRRALSEYLVEGVQTTIPFHREIVGHPQFRKGQFDTEFIENTFMTQYQ